MPDKLLNIKQQPRFFQINFRRLLNLSYVLLGIIFLLLMLAYYQHIAKPKPHYFATTSDGRLVEITPLAINP